MATRPTPPLLNDIAIYVEVAKQRHFTRAAEALGMPVSTVSRRVRTLEEEIGTALLKRSTRSVDLTEAGALFYESCLEVVEQARLAHEQLLTMTQQVKGVLRISMPSSLGLVFMPSIITGFMNEYPDIECDFDLSIRPIDLVAENFDCVIRTGEQADSNLIARRLGQLSLSLFASRGYLQQYGRPEHPSDLSQHRCITARQNELSCNWTLHHPQEKSVTVEVAGRLRVNNALMMHRLAANDAGIAIFSQAENTFDPNYMPLEPVLPGWHFAPYPIYALLPSRMLPLKTRVFLDYVRDQLTLLLNHH